MEALLTSMIVKSAHRLGLAADAEVTRQARATAIDALRSGAEIEDAFDCGRSVLIRATQPAEAFCAA